MTRPAQPELRARLTREVPSRLEVGRGNALFIEGECWHPTARISGPKVLIDEAEHPVIAYGMPSPDNLEHAPRWWAVVGFAPIDTPRTATIGLRARIKEDGRIVTAQLATIQLEPGPETGGRTADAGGRPDDSPLIAICMATRRPPSDLFESQIASIKGQTHENWMCLISDDNSGPRALAEMTSVIGDDPRFHLRSHPEQLGFYGNFERTLKLVPSEASYVAFTDQDDRWYPDKLEVLASTLENEGANLVYSDMRIVTESGEVVSDTFWRYRRNNHTDFASVLIANTITGAASLFRRDLLDYALPFPPRHHKSFHDQWIAAVALALGTVSYVARPLYDYVQHGTAAQGFLNANRKGVERAEARGSTMRRRYGAVLRRRQEPKPPRPTVGARWRAVYFNPYMRTQLIARVLQMRCGPLMTRKRRRTIKRVLNVERSRLGLAWLAVRSLRPLVGATETFGRERRLLGAVLWRRLARPRYLVRRTGARFRRIGDMLIARTRTGSASTSKPSGDTRQAGSTYGAASDVPFDETQFESRLVWILGSPRTGSTWLLSLLIHPLRLRADTPINCVAGPGRLPSQAVVPINEPWVPSHFTPLEAPADLASRPDQPETSAFRLNQRRASTPGYLFSDHYSSVWRPALRRLVLLRFHAQVERAVEEIPLASDPIVVVKEPNGSYGADALMPIFRHSRMIFLQRDGRDVVDSLRDRQMSDRVPPAERLEDDEGSRLRFVREHSRHWVNSMRATQAAFDAHSPDLRTIVRYEDLLEDTHGTLARLYQWLGADRTDAAVDSAVKANAFEAAPKEARGVGKARRAATPGLWRYNLSEREQEAIHEIMGEQLGMLGYEPERRIPTGLRTIAESR